MMLMRFLMSGTVLLMAFVLMCLTGDPVVYASGRDTFRAFGNGRFQLMYGDRKNGRYNYELIDCERASEALVLKGVVDSIEVSDSIYLCTEDGGRHLVDMGSGRLVTYVSGASIPESQRKTFCRMEARTWIQRVVEYWGFNHVQGGIGVFACITCVLICSVRTRCERCR